MKILFLNLLIITHFSCSTTNNDISVDSSQNSPTTISYSVAALGSGMGNKMPYFEVKNEHFIYLKKQNSSLDGNFDHSSDTLCKGTFSTKTLDSILEITATAPQSIVKKSDPRIMSGSIVSLTIVNDSVYTSFTLHNAYDSIADQIIQLINTQIPEDKNPLYIFNSKKIPQTEGISLLPDSIHSN